MQKVFIETRLEDVDLTKLNHTAIQVLGIYGTRKSKPRVKGELLKEQYTVTFCDCNYLAHVIVPGAPNENIVQNHLNIASLNVF